MKLAQEEIQPGPGVRGWKGLNHARALTLKASLLGPLCGLGLGFRRAHPRSGLGPAAPEEGRATEKLAAWPPPYQ